MLNGTYDPGRLVVEAVAFFALAFIVGTWTALELQAYLRNRQTLRLRRERARRDAALRAEQTRPQVSGVRLRISGVGGWTSHTTPAVQTQYANYAGFNEVRR